MDPSAPLEQGVQAKEKKKIHFSVPTIPPTQLDPRQVEMIRRRRPTPATLFRVAEHPSPEDDITTHQWVVGENGVLKPRRVNPSVYQPPSLKAVQRMAEAHMQTLGTCPPLEDPSEGDESEDYLCLREEGEEGSEENEENEESPTHGAGQMETGSVDSQSERMLRTEDGAELNQGSKRGNESEEDEQEDEDTEARRMGSD